MALNPSNSSNMEQLALKGLTTHNTKWNVSCHMAEWILMLQWYTVADILHAITVYVYQSISWFINSILTSFKISSVPMSIQSHVKRTLTTDRETAFHGVGLHWRHSNIKEDCIELVIGVRQQMQNVGETTKQWNDLRTYICTHGLDNIICLEKHGYNNENTV